MTLGERIRVSRFLRFAIVGGIGFFLNEAVLLFAMRFLRLDPYSAGIFAFAVTVTFTWFGNRLLTFREQTAKGAAAMFVEWAKFVAANGVGFAVNYSVYASLIHFAPSPANNPFLALAGGTLTGLVFNFTLSKRLVFRSPV